MGFVVERIPKGDPIESTDVHSQAVSVKRGLPIRQRFADRSRAVYLYTISVNSYEERPPGKYLLFVDGLMATIEAYHRLVDAPGDELVLKMIIYSVKLPPELEIRRAEVMGLVREAFEARGLQGEPKVTGLEMMVWQREGEPGIP